MGFSNIKGIFSVLVKMIIEEYRETDRKLLKIIIGIIWLSVSFLIWSYVIRPISPFF